MRTLISFAIVMCLTLGAGVLSTSRGESPNFATTDSQVQSAAEKARLASARFWTGGPLPGAWSRPCPITLRLNGRAGRGETSFVFRYGEVFGWSMLLDGPRQTILSDVLPHEVDHAVRASLTRRPIARWLDEGCATLMESPESHARLRRQATAYQDMPLTIDWLDRQDYPAATDRREIERLYAIGFSLVEYLLEQGGPRQLLVFQQDPRLPSQKFRDHYGSDAGLIITGWKDWQQQRSQHDPDCSSVGCTVHAASFRLSACHCTEQPTNLLTAWTATWCAPCRQFWTDFRNDAEFRTAIQSRFHLHAIDVDQQRRAAATAEIKSVPVFQTQQSQINGYQGKAWLLEQLGIASHTATDKPDRPQPEPQPRPQTVPLTVPLVDSGSIVDSSPSLGEPPQTVPVAAAGDEPFPQAHPTDRSTPPATSEETDRDTAWLLPSLSRIIGTTFPVALTALQIFGVLGGTAATGGIGALALRAAWRLLRRRIRRRRARSNIEEQPDVVLQSEGGQTVTARAPFPRQLDEARQLLSLRQPDGRVAVLDALRGMFLDDELQKLTDSPDEREASLARRLRNNIDTRVDEVAPLSTTIN